MHNNFFSNQGVDDAQILTNGHENHQGKMHGVTGLGHPPYSQHAQPHHGIEPDYQDFIQNDDRLCPPQMPNCMTQLPHCAPMLQIQNVLGHGFENTTLGPVVQRRPTIEDLVQYLKSTPQPNACNTNNCEQPLMSTPKPSQTPVYKNQVPYYPNQVSPHQAASPVSMNRPTSPQTMIYAAQGGQVMYPMHHYQKPSPARISTDGSCTSTSTISTAGSCTPAAGTISMDASCTSTSTISQVPTGRVVSDDEDKSSMSELEKFAQDTKRRRLRMGFTQENVGNGLGALYNNRFSQTTVCRFEAGQLSLANMRKLKPIINKWLDEVESNAASRAIVNDGEKLKNYGKRKRRTFIQAATKSYLELCYEQCPNPTKSDIEIISEKSKMEYEVIRIWFCNRRQKSKKELDKCLKEQTITFGNFAQPIPASNTGNWVMPPMAVPQPWLLDMAASNHTPYMATNNQNGQFIQHAMQRMPPGNYTQ